METQDEVRVAWGMGIAGHVAQSGEPVNIPDAYQVRTRVLIIQLLPFPLRSPLRFYLIET